MYIICIFYSACLGWVLANSTFHNTQFHSSFTKNCDVNVNNIVICVNRLELSDNSLHFTTTQVSKHVEIY